MIAVGAETLAETARLVGGRYELEALIGKGGVGEVWRARHVALNSRVAIKFLQLASAQKESAQRRFTTEAQVTAQLKTAHAVQVFDFGVTDDGQPYLVMELLEGETLGRRLERLKRLGIEETVRFLGQAARALHRAHALGIVHRDFKPDNIVISEDEEGRDQVKVLDFGVAKLLGALEDGAEGEEPGGAEHPPAAPSFTRTGAVLGTPLYMAPEQIRNPSDVDLKADIWAFGVVAFECLTGRPPFTGSSVIELFERIQSGQRPSAVFLEPSLPSAFDVWFDVACAPDPEKRFINASVAWKHLTVALDSEGQSRSGSFPGLDPHEASGQRRVVVVPGEERTDTSAPTLEGRPRELQTRSHDDEFHSLRRIPRAALTMSSVAPPSPATMTTPAEAESSRSARRRWMVAVAVTVSALVGLTVWRVAVHPSEGAATAPATSQAVVSRAANAATGDPSGAAPGPATVAAATAPVVSASAPAASASAPRAGTRAATSATRAGTTPARAATPVAEAPSASAPAFPATDGRNATPPPAPSATAAFDLGSYR